VNCISEVAQARNWKAHLDRLDLEARKIHERILPAVHVDSCVLTNLKKTLDIRHLKGAPGMVVRFDSCQRIIERNVSDFLKEPFISSLEFENCTLFSERPIHAAHVEPPND